MYEYGFARNKPLNIHLRVLFTATKIMKDSPTSCIYNLPFKMIHCVMFNLSLHDMKKNGKIYEPE